MSKTIKIENGSNVNCFVPSCSNKKTIDGHPIHFFQVPQGNEGLCWKVAVNSSQSQHERTIGILGRKTSPSFTHCCELHFNIETDSIVIIDPNGDVEFKMKPGIFPSIKPTNSKRLWEILRNDNKETIQEIDRNDTETDFLQPMRNECETENATHNGDFISIVDMSTLICKNFDDITPSSQVHGYDNPIEVKFTPLMPITVELMRRKPVYYMGLDQSLFFRLLQIIKSTSSDMGDSSSLETKIMLTLRKHRLNEEFEALGDMFDIDKTTAQQYYAESKNLVSNLYHSLTTMAPSMLQEPNDDVKNPLWIEHSIFDNSSTGDHHADADERTDDEDSSEPEIKYKGYAVEDSDVDSDDFKDSDSESDGTEIRSDELDNSDFESDESEGKSTKEKSACPICLRYVDRLDSHMETNHLNPQYLNKTLCGLCFRKFENHKRLRAHQKDIHDGNACVCDVCGKMFPKFSSAKEHILKVHSKLKPFLCHLCAASYNSLSKLKIHFDKAHLQIRSHECSLCDKKYFQSMELQAHIRSVHTKERPFQCRFDGCGKSFCRSGNRYIHEQMHKVKFSCEICSKVFSFRHNLQTHCKNIHGKNVIDTERCKIEINQ